MGKRVVLMMMVVVVMVLRVEVCRCWGSSADDWVKNTKETANLAVENAKIKAEDIKRAAEDAMQEAKENGESWTDSAFAMFSNGFGLQKENTREASRNLMDRTVDAASKATDIMNSAAYETSSYASQKAGEAADMAYEKSGGINDFASEKADQANGMASDKASDASQTFAGAMEYGKDKVAYSYGYDDAKQKRDIAKDEVSDKANVDIDAKQKMNMATDGVHDAKERMGETVDNGRNKAADAYDKASNKASDQANEVKESVSGAMGYRRDGDTYDEAKNNMKTASNIVTEKVDDAREAVAGTMGSGGKDERDAFFEAKNKVGEAYTMAKDAMTEQGKTKYEAAKEKLSKAAGDIGQKMRKEPADI